MENGMIWLVPSEEPFSTEPKRECEFGLMRTIPFVIISSLGVLPDAVSGTVGNKGGLCVCGVFLFVFNFCYNL